MDLFNAQFRIQREASEAAGRHIPMVVENVKGAQKWVGRARWHYGSFYLWGDVPALMPMATAKKNNGGSWFAVANNTVSGHSRNPVHELTKGQGGSWFGGTYAERKARWPDSQITTGSKSKARKAASAAVAKIPFALSSHIARVYYPRMRAAA